MDWFYVICAALLGLVVGSFLNVVIARLPQRQSLGGRSHCPRCNEPIAWYDNLPVVSWLALRARCRRCRQPIAWRYPLVELVTAGLFAAVAAASDDWRTVLAGIVFMSFLVPLTFIDIDLKILPNRLTYPGTVVGLALSIGLGPQPRFMSEDLWWVEVLVSALAASGFLLVAAIAYPAGMGLGDVKLALMMGAFLGAPVAVAMMLSFVLGLVPSIVLTIRYGWQRARKVQIPFGPYLTIAAAISWFYGRDLLELYLSGFATA